MSVFSQKFVFLFVIVIGLYLSCFLAGAASIIYMIEYNDIHQQNRITSAEMVQHVTIIHLISTASMMIDEEKDYPSAMA